MTSGLLSSFLPGVPKFLIITKPSKPSTLKLLLLVGSKAIILIMAHFAKVNGWLSTIDDDPQSHREASPGAWERWENESNAGPDGYEATSGGSPSDDDEQTLIDIVGRHDSSARQSAPEGAHYCGPRASINLRYPPGKTPASCHTAYWDRGEHHYRLTIQSCDTVKLPDGTTRALKNMFDRHSVAAALVCSQFGGKGWFGPEDEATLEQGLIDSLQELYRRVDSIKDYSLTTEVDAATGKTFVVATSNFADEDYARYSAAVEFIETSPHSSS